MDVELSASEKASSKRTIRSFEPDSDVQEMLATAQASGFKVADICNAALRCCGLSVIEAMNDKRNAGVRRISSAVGGSAQASATPSFAGQAARAALQKLATDASISSKSRPVASGRSRRGRRQ